MNQLRAITGTVAQCVQETRDTWTLHIDLAPEDRVYQAGQFLSVDPHQFSELAGWVAYLEHCKGRREAVRVYSMASSPHEPFVSITVKPEEYQGSATVYPPLLSPLLASPCLQGRRITFNGYTGAYTLRYLNEPIGQGVEMVLHLTAGSGVVPNFALLKEDLHNDKHPNVHHVLVDVNKTHDDIIFRHQLGKLARHHPARFHLHHLLTREEDPQQHGQCYIAGRPTLELLRRLVPHPDRTLVYACGPALTKWQKQHARETGEVLKPRFLETVTELVRQLGIDRSRFKTEAYG